MVQKRHQEEISGPTDTIEAAPLTKDCPRLKRARIQSRKAQENQAQSQPVEVLFLRSTRTTPSEQLRSEHSPSTGNNLSQSKRRQSPNRQNSSQRASKSIQHSKEKKDWQKQVESTQNKSKKLQILAEQIDPYQSYSEKLNVPILYTLEHSKLSSYEHKSIDLFYRFIPNELFADIAEHINEYAFKERSQEFDQNQREWIDVTAADIGDYIDALLLIDVQSGSRDLVYY